MLSTSSKEMGWGRIGWVEWRVGGVGWHMGGVGSARVGKVDDACTILNPCR